MRILRSSSKKGLIITGVVVVLVLGAAGAYWWMSQSDQNQIASGEQAAEQAGNFVKEEDIDAEPAPTQNNEEKVIISDPEDNNSGTPPEKPNLTRAEQSGDDIRIAATFSDASSGNCRLLMSKEGYQDIERTVKIIVAPNYYTCNGFRIPRSEMPVGGQWQVRVIHEQDGRSTSSDEKTITVS